MIGRHVSLEREVIKQSTLIHPPLAQHRMSPPLPPWSESARERRRNFRVFQQNRPEAALRPDRHINEASIRSHSLCWAASNAVWLQSLPARSSATVGLSKPPKPSL